MIASTTASEIWSHILSGCPSVTDSEVKRYSRSGMGLPSLPCPPHGRACGRRYLSTDDKSPRRHADEGLVRARVYARLALPSSARPRRTRPAAIWHLAPLSKQVAGASPGAVARPSAPPSPGAPHDESLPT